MRRKPLLDQAIAERGVKAGLLWLSREAGLDDVSSSEKPIKVVFIPFIPHANSHK
jgi:hypothetical protein